MGLFHAYLRSLKSPTKDDRRRQFQKQQWRRRVDAQMRAASQRSSGRTVPCPNCSAQITFPAPGTWTCTKCGYAMMVTFGLNTTTVRETGPPSPAGGRAASSTATELERLAKLHRSGALTDTEFAAAKAKVLGH